MELPKNVTQIGESDRTCKVYVEDYVVSYLKQLNQVARNKDIAVALYGIRKEEGEVSYLFLYGAAKLNFLQREVRHLSQAQLQEIEQNRQRFFSEYEFQGYRLLNGEMIEGFHICERGICRYIAGYAQFYEKNDSMLNFMLEARSEEVQPEVVNQEKYENVKRRQEARKAQAEEGRSVPRKAEVSQEAGTSQGVEVPEEGLSVAERSALSQAWKKEQPKGTGLRRMKVAAVAIFLLLCLVGLTSMNGGLNLEDIQVMAKQTLNGLTEQRLPNEGDQAVPAMGTPTNSDTLVTEDKLTEAVRQENKQKEQMGQETTPPDETSHVAGEAQINEEKTPETIPEETTEQPTEPSGEVATEVGGQAMVSYVIERGDTLTSICMRNYGSDARVQEICRINSIADPDDIKVGQKILLPQ
ncbi:MAG: LysM peptidoglycan-binding domain-containing protein [Acetatifactor sp.]|nr:LysM peptidoglycan-binding domain-containing protein [Acetatifactor sp.]